MEDGGWRIDEAYKFGVEEVKIFAPTLKGEFSMGWCLRLTLRVAGVKIFASTLKGGFSMGWCLCLTLRVAGLKIFASTLKGEFSSVGVYV